MIHAIYIYFIINAFIAGYEFHSGWKYSVYVLLFGVPHHIIVISFAISVSLFLLFRRKTWIITYYQLWFTDYYKDKQLDVEAVEKALKDNKRWEMIFLNKYLKKYNHKND